MDLNLDLEVLFNKVIYFYLEYMKVLVRTVTGIFKRPIQEMKNPNSNPIVGLIKGIYGVYIILILKKFYYRQLLV